MDVADILSDPRRRFITDGGLETTLVFKDGRDLPAFAAFPLLFEDEGRARLTRYFHDYIEIAADHEHGFIFGAPTWRANPAWVRIIGYCDDDITRAGELSVELASKLKETYRDRVPDFLISGSVGPKEDGYIVSNRMSPDGAAEFHSFQIRSLKAAGVDFISAMTLTYADEAIGIARAAHSIGIPCILSFTVETDGKLPSGESLEDAIQSVDCAKGTDVTYFMINCAHPTHFVNQLSDGGDWVYQICGIRANASSMSHADLEAASELDEGIPAELALYYRYLQSHLDLQIIGGCCGTDHHHVRKIAETCLPPKP